MAVREEQDRRVGRDSEKLLTLSEAARRLDVPADDVKALISTGKLAAFRIGGAHLRIRPADLEGARHYFQSPPTPPAPAKSHKPAVVHPAGARKWGRFSDFFYFNDFYIVALLLILTLLALILTL